MVKRLDRVLPVRGVAGKGFGVPAFPKLPMPRTVGVWPGLGGTFADVKWSFCFPRPEGHSVWEDGPRSQIFRGVSTNGFSLQIGINWSRNSRSYLCNVNYNQHQWNNRSHELGTLSIGVRPYFRSNDTIRIGDLVDVINGAGNGKGKLEGCGDRVL